MNESPQPDEASPGLMREWDDSDRRDWIAVGVICALIIWALDGSLISAVAWLVMSLLRTYREMPAVFRAAGRLSARRRPFLFHVALGWALIPGPLVGSLLGTLSPLIVGLPISSFTGGLIGLIVGPIIAAIEGVLLASATSFIVWVVTGKSLFDKTV